VPPDRASARRLTVIAARLLRACRNRLAVIELLIVAHVWRLSARDVGVAVTYHRVARVSGDPAVELVPAVSTAVLLRQLWLFKTTFDIVPASELPRRIRDRARGNRIPLAITFDDDLRCHAKLSAPLLRRLGATATFFVCGAELGAIGTYWWELLQEVIDGGNAVAQQSGIPEPVAAAWNGRRESIHAVASEILKLDPDARDRVARRLAEIGSTSGQRHTPLSLEGIRSLAADGFEIGFHTLRHDYLPGLDDRRLRDALVTGRTDLERAVGHRLVAIAYPHGGGDERIAAAARAAGYCVGFTTSGDAIDTDQDPLLLGRVECSYRSATQLAARVHRALRRAHS